MIYKILTFIGTWADGNLKHDAFANNNLDNIILPNNLISIQDRAF
jgi:hypothetical protein